MRNHYIGICLLLCVFFPHFKFKYFFFLLKKFDLFSLFTYFSQKVKKFTLDETNHSEAASNVKEKQ